jgi:putative transposase
MPNYIRPKVSGSTIFFTVALAQRGSWLLVDEIDALRDAVKVTRTERPFGIDAWGERRTRRAIDPVDQSRRERAERRRSCRIISTRCGRCRRETVIFPPDGARSRRGFRCRAVGRGFTPLLPVGARNGGVNPALQRKGEVGLWQPRFWEHHIRDETDYWNHVRYCWLNPVKHGFVDLPEDWPYSSVHWDERFAPGMDVA